MFTFVDILIIINIIMKDNDIEAILGYLEFHLITFVEQMEGNITDPDVIGDMYDKAYSILTDFERTLDTQMFIDNQQRGSAQNS